MPTEQPDLAGAGHSDRSGLGCVIVCQLLSGAEEAVQVGRVEARGGRVGRCQRAKHVFGLVGPRGKLGRAVVGDREEQAFNAGQIRPHRGDVGPAQAHGRGERAVPGDHHSGFIDDDWLLLAEPRQRRGDRGDRAGRVLTEIRGILVEVSDRDRVGA